MATFIRGSNPVWLFDDLTGNLFDDTFYMYVLQNEIPYLPATVYHDSAASTPWTNPIRFFANGTLPIDIYWDPDVVYRLEFRHNISGAPSQADPLIYLVENYQPGAGGSTPIDNVALFSENQITNPQFSLLSFSPPFTLTSVTNPDPIEVAPGWFLVLTGTGSVTLDRVALNNAEANPTNAPYALRITLSGAWTGSPTLRQRFNQNGMLWANKYVSSSITARIEGAPDSISARLVDSLGTPLIDVLALTEVNDAFNEYRGHGLVPPTTNTDVPPDAWIDYELLLPQDVDIFVTSFQLIESDVPVEFVYEQDSIERQVDHTWHYYANEVILKPKNSILTAWNFSLNPFQFQTTTITTIATQTQYIADCTILHQQSAGGTVQSGKSAVTQRDCLVVKALNGFTTNKFALIQYIDPKTIRPYWSYLLSSLARARIFTSHGTQVGIKMRLIYSASLPALISNTEPISSWAGVNPVFSGSWTEIVPKNDPVYILPNSYATGEGAGDAAFPAFPFEAFKMPNMTNDAMTLGIVIYTTENMNPALGTEDYIAFDRISLVPNAFAVDTQPQTFDEVLRQCQFYYEKSYNMGVLPGAVSLLGMQTQEQGIIVGGGNIGLRTTNLFFPYKTQKRITPTSTHVGFFSPATGTASTVYGVTYNGAASINAGNITSTAWTAVQYGEQSATFAANNVTQFIPVVGVANSPWSTIDFHYVIDVNLGSGI